LGLGPGPGSLVARWCSGLARVENNDPANDGLWTPETRKRPIDGSSNLPRATIDHAREYVRYRIRDRGVKNLLKTTDQVLLKGLLRHSKVPDGRVSTE